MFSDEEMIEALADWWEKVENLDNTSGDVSLTLQKIPLSAIHNSGAFGPKDFLLLKKNNLIDLEK